MQLAALALPADPPSFALVPDAPAMKQEEARAVPGRPIARVQPRDAGGRFVEKRFVVGVVLGCAIAPVGDQRESEIVVRIGKMMNLQPLDLLFDRRCAGEQRRHDDDCAQIRRDTVAQFQSRQNRPADLSGDRAVHDRDRDIRGRNEADNRQNKKQPAGDPNICDGEQCEREDDRGDDRDHAHIAHHAQIGIELEEPGPERYAAAEFLLEGAAAFGDEIISRIAFAPRRGILFGRLVRRAPGGRYRAPGDLDFVVARFAREFLDRAPVKIACRKIHRREIAGAAQHRIDRTDAFEELRPVDRRDQAHARDHVADGDVRRALALNLLAHDLVGGRSFRRQSVVQPAQRRRNIGIAIAQALGELDGECGRPGRLIEAVQDRRRRFGIAFGGAQESGPRAHRPTGSPICCATIASAKTAQIFDQRDAQRDRDRPQFADGQRLDPLISLDEAREFLDVEGAVGVGDECPGDAEHARIALQRPVRQFRQLAVDSRAADRS